MPGRSNLLTFSNTEERSWKLLNSNVLLPFPFVADSSSLSPIQRTTFIAASNTRFGVPPSTVISAWIKRSATQNVTVAKSICCSR